MPPGVLRTTHPLPSLVLADLLTVANYKKALAVRFPFACPLRPYGLLGGRSVPRLKISHRLFAARCLAAIIDRGRLLPRGYRPKPRLCLRCLRVAHNAADYFA